MVTIGFLVILISVLLMVFKSMKEAGKGSVEGGGVIIIGPIPIAFGTSKKITGILLILAIILFLLTVISFIMPYIVIR